MEMWHRLVEHKPAFWVNLMQIHLRTDVLDNRTGHRYRKSKHWGNLEGREHLGKCETTNLSRGRRARSRNVRVLKVEDGKEFPEEGFTALKAPGCAPEVDCLTLPPFSAVPSRTDHY